MDEGEWLAEVRRWVRYAQEDLAGAELLLRNPGIAQRNTCFLAQQAAEKAVKAIFVWLQVDFPFIHDLGTLRDGLPPGWRVRDEQIDLSGLADWAVEGRYPGDVREGTPADAERALGQARAVLESVLEDLTSRGFRTEDG